MLAHLFAALLGAAPGATPAACAELPAIGPVEAPIRVQWFFDPMYGNNLGHWFAIRRLVGDLDGEVAFSPVIVAGATRRTPEEERVRAWFAAAACHGHSERALRLLAREGNARLARRLAEKEGRRALATVAGITVAALDDPGLHALIERGSANFHTLANKSSERTGRAPAFAVASEDIFADGTRLEAVRRAIESERRPTIVRRRSVAKVMRKGVSAPLLRPPASAGMLLGGVALPHRLVVFAEQEDHPDFLRLGAVLELRARLPGWVAIQVIARGQSRAGVVFRRRLCAAAALGRELDYLRLLARLTDSETANALRETLDAHNGECASAEQTLRALREDALNLPSGSWLDGAAVGQRELANLEHEILRIEATTSPLDAVFSAAAPPDP